jgi:MYXO-CTERM domain-containing protein
MIDWPNLGANYGEVISIAVDAEGAEGRAFVTEFAGEHDLLEGSFYRPSWALHGLTEVTDPTLAMPGLMNAGLMDCYFDGVDDVCLPSHPLMTGLLTKYLPPPAGVDGPAFWGCLECYADQIDVAAWNGPGFAADILTRIVQPGEHARDLVSQFPYLTRLYTLISPWEMSADPMFYENPDLPPVPSLRMATQTVDCDGDSVWTLPDGRNVNVPSGMAWPEFPEAMPYEERVEQGLASGPNQVLFSRTQLIDDLLADWNAANPVIDEAGCACSTTDGGGLAGAAFFAVAFGGLLRRRRR